MKRGKKKRKIEMEPVDIGGGEIVNVPVCADPPQKSTVSPPPKQEEVEFTSPPEPDGDLSDE